LSIEIKVKIGNLREGRICGTERGSLKKETFLETQKGRVLRKEWGSSNESHWDE